MALRHSGFYAPLLMTMAGGFLRDEGLEHTYEPATPEKTVPDSIANGTCHVAQSAVAASFAALEQGVEPGFVHFAQINQRDGFFIAGRKPETNFKWANLVGKRVLVDHFFQPLAMLKYGLHRQGIAYEDLIVINAGDVSAIDAAFRSGEGDYVHQQGPAPQQLAHDGVGHVVAAVGDAVGPVAFSSLCAAPDWLETDAARAFIRAYQRALAYVVVAPPTEMASRLAAAGFFPGIDMTVLAQTLAAYQQLGCWSRDAQISEESYENLLNVFMFNNLITQRHPYQRVIVNPPG
jgi:NitT/TauT family transport system substrate-binding protein